MKFAYRNREFWCKGYYVDTVGKNTAAIKEYIANQIKKASLRDKMGALKILSEVFAPRKG